MQRHLAHVLLLIALLAGFSDLLQAQTPTAWVWVEKLVIPTYELGEPDPYPAFPTLNPRQRRPIYPYPLLDEFTDRKVDKAYTAVFLENEYLKVTVLPELGGKLYAIFDKI